MGIPNLGDRSLNQLFPGVPNSQIRHQIRDKVENYTINIFIVIYSLMVLVPLSILFIQAFNVLPLPFGLQFKFSFDNFVQVLTSPIVRGVFANTFIYVVGTVFIAHALGFLFAFILTRLDIPFRSLFHTLMFLPIFVSPLIVALGYSYSFIEGGIFYQVQQLLGIGPINFTNIWGMVFVGSLELVPYAYSFISSGLQNLDPDLEASARISGSSEITILREISLPLLKPFILSSLLITVLWALQAVSVPVIVGLPSKNYILSTYIIALSNLIQPPPYGQMAAIGVILIVVTGAIAISIQRYLGDLSEYTVITGGRKQRSIQTSRRTKILAVGFTSTYLFVVLVLPVFQILSIAFSSSNTVTPFYQAQLSFEWFAALFANPSITLAIKNSVIISVVTASGTVVLTGMMAYIVNRMGGIRSKVLDLIAWFPIATPGIVLGVSYLLTVVILPGGLYGTIFILMIAFFVRLSALGMRMNSSLIAQQALELDNQGKIVGSTLFSRLRHIIFPNAKNGMMSIWILLFLMFMSELSTSLFLYTSNSRVITVTLYELWLNAQIGLLSALSSVQLVISLGTVFVLIVVLDIDVRAV